LTWEVGNAGQEIEALSRKGASAKCAKAWPPEGKGGHSMTLQGNPIEGNCKPSWPLPELPCEDVLSTWEGPGPWDPGGGPAGKRIVNSKRPVEAMDIAAGIDAHNKMMQQASSPTRKTLAVGQSASTIPKSQPCTFIPLLHCPIPPPSRFVFVSRPIKRALYRPGRC